MKKFKLLTALFVMLFVSTVAFGQTVPFIPYTFVQDYTEFICTGEGLIDPSTLEEVKVVVEWVGSDGTTMTRIIVTTVSELALGMNVYTYALHTSGFYPVLQTNITIKYCCEYHLGRYNGFASSAIRANDPDNWQVFSN